MEKYTAHVLRFVGSFLARFKSPRWWGSALGGLVLTLLTIYWEETVKAAWEAVWPHVWRVLQAPLWKGGIFLVALLALALVLSWWDTRPKAEKPLTEPAPAPPLTDEDREAMQDFRVLWNRYGADPAKTLATLFETVQHRLANFGGAYWTGLLAPNVCRLRDARLAMDSGLAPESQLNMTELQERFEEFYNAYLNGVKWIARLVHNDDLVLETPEARRLERWKKEHRAFYDKLHDMHEKPLYKGNLKIVPEIWGDDQPYADLLAEAERPLGAGSSSASAILVKRSMPDTEAPSHPESEAGDPGT